MNNLYHKVAVASISIALSLTLGTDKQAKATTITLAPAQFFNTIDRNGNGQGDSYTLPYLGLRSFPVGTFYQDYSSGTTRPAYEFNIGNLSLAPNTTIKSAKFNAVIRSLRISPGDGVYVALFGYTGNGQPDASDFEAGEPFPLVSESLYSYDYRNPTFNISWDVAPFINQLLSNNTSAFAGLRVEGDRFSVEGVSTFGDPSDPYSIWYPTLEITTEPVPEPTTIFGSALALSLGGWLKRKKSSQHNKTTP